MEFEDYKDKINLEPEKLGSFKLDSNEKSNILSKLLKVLKNDPNIEQWCLDEYTEPRDKLRATLNITPPYKFSEEFFKLQDELLTSETNERGIVEVEKLKYNGNIALWQGDITRLNADAIVNAGNSGLLGCFAPLHNCIDNIIISSGGFQIRNDLGVIMRAQGHEERVGDVKVTAAYNLPSKFVFHTVGPCVSGEVSEEDERGLATCYASCIDQACKMRLQTLAFCCISTGEFRFPNDLACKIAVETVKNKLKAVKGLGVIFNVFKDIDKEYYERELCQKSK